MPWTRALALPASDVSTVRRRMEVKLEGEQYTKLSKDLQSFTQQMLSVATELAGVGDKKAIHSALLQENGMCVVSFDLNEQSQNSPTLQSDSRCWLRHGTMTHRKLLEVEKRRWANASQRICTLERCNPVTLTDQSTEKRKGCLGQG